jgi:23S rRNA pseudouridine1911/1915/1917 synthase
MTAHPGSGHIDDTVANAAAYKWPQIVDIGEPDRPGIVHRLDKDTSGLMVIALTEPAYIRLSEMIRNHEITRIYSALVHGIPKSQKGVVDAPIGRSPYYRKRQAIDENGRPSRTHYRVDYVFGDFAFLEIRLETGRMHQIRVHMDAIGHPVIGDQTYGRQKNLPNLNRQFLHASKLEFDHPVTGKRLSVTSELPADLTRALEALQ